MKKSVMIGIIVVLVIGVFAIGYFVSKESSPIGCTEDAKICPDGSVVGRNPDLNCEFDSCPEGASQYNVPNGELTAPIYLSNIEATVISVELDELENEDCGILFETSKICPRDKVIVTIDSYENVDAPGEKLLEVGSEVAIYFEYSARPAKLLKDREQICEGLDEDKCPPDYVTVVAGRGCRIPDGTIIDCDSIYLEDKPTEIDGGFIVYHFSEDYNKLEDDITLQGIEAGDRIRFTSSVVRKDYVGTFQVDSQVYDLEKYELIVNGEAECESKGGIWHEYALPSDKLLEDPYCQLPFSDNGILCADSSQCIGNCEPPQEYLSREPDENGLMRWVVPFRENVTGTCSKFSMGCSSYQIVNGTLGLNSQTVCIV